MIFNLNNPTEVNMSQDDIELSPKIQEGISEDEGETSDKHEIGTIKQQLRTIITDNYFNILLIIIPFGILSGYLHWGDTAVFVLNFLCMIPLAALLVWNNFCIY